LLLDVTNLCTNAVNYCFDPLAWIERLPAERIVQLHFVRGTWQADVIRWEVFRIAPQVATCWMQVVRLRWDIPGWVRDGTELPAPRARWLVGWRCGPLSYAAEMPVLKCQC
jgi:hypothetical protein